MDTSVLQPPNCHGLSDEVVGTVKLQSAKADRFRVNTPHLAYQLPQSSSNKKKNLFDVPTQSVPECIRVGEPASSVMLSPPQSIDNKEKISKIVELVLLDQGIQRKQRRENQRRYRKKQDDHLTTLVKDVRQLHEHVKQLERRKHLALFSIPTKNTIWNVVVEYFRVFRHGLPSVAYITTGPSRPSVQLDFVRSSLMKNVVFNSERGVNALLQCWGKLTLWFQDVEVTLEGIEKSGAGSFIATTETSITITERMLCNVFPYLCEDDNGLMSSLIVKLLDQRITMRGVTRFEWNAAFGRVKSVAAESDMLTPMLQLLGNLRDVSSVFENALISPSFQVKTRM